jgi:hypothetical protein
VSRLSHTTKTTLQTLLLPASTFASWLCVARQCARLWRQKKLEKHADSAAAGRAPARPAHAQP